MSSHRTPTPANQNLARERRLKARQELPAVDEHRTTPVPPRSTPHRELLKAQLNIAPTIETEAPGEGVPVEGAPSNPHSNSSGDDGDNEDRPRSRSHRLPSRPRTHARSSTSGSDRSRIRRRNPDRDPPSDPNRDSRRELFSVAPHNRSIAYIQQDSYNKKPPDFKGLKRNHHTADNWLRRHKDFHFFNTVSISRDIVRWSSQYLIEAASSWYRHQYPAESKTS